MRRGREAGHVHADLGDDHRGRGGSDPRDLIQAGHRVSERGQLFLGSLLEGVDVGAERVDAGEHRGQQERVVVAEPSDERLHKAGVLGPHPASRHLGQHLWVTFSGDQGGHHLPARDPEDVADHD